MKLPEWDLTCEYLEALKVVREAGYAFGLPMLVRNVSVEWSPVEFLPCATIIHNRQKNSIRVLVNPAIGYMTSYRVERIEVLTYITAECITHLSDMQAPELASLCIKLGCANTRLMGVRERWRRLGMEIDPRLKDGWRSGSLVALMYEDRPPCGWCKSPLTTGSNSLMRKDLHEGCYDYIMKVVRPQLVEERRQRQAKEAAAAEK